MIDLSLIKSYSSRGGGRDWDKKLAAFGASTVVEDGVRIFHPENVRLGANAFVGHSTIIDGYHIGHVSVGDGSWIGAFSFVHGAGGIDIGRAVGIGPRVTILTSQHDLGRVEIPVLHAELVLEPVTIGDGADIGTGAVILPGVTIGEGAVVGAGAVVTGDIPARTVAAGNPARVVRQRA